MPPVKPNSRSTPIQSDRSHKSFPAFLGDLLKTTNQSIQNFFIDPPNVGKKLSSIEFGKVLKKIKKDKNHDLKEKIDYHFWYYPFKSYPIYKLSNHSILVEKQPFEVALKLAIHYLDVRKRQNFIWKKVYYQKPTHETSRKVDAYKFFYHKDDHVFLEYFLNQGQYRDYSNYDYKNDRMNVFIKLINDIHNQDITREQIKKKLKSLNIKATDSLLNVIIQDKRNWTKFHQYSQNQKFNGKITLILSDDLLKVFAVKTKPEYSGREVDSQDLLQACKQQHVTQGLNEKWIEDFLNKPVYNQSVLIGEVASIQHDYRALYEESYLKNPNSSPSSYSKIRLLFMVHKNDILLKRLLPKGEKPKQYDVLGQVHPLTIDESKLLVSGNNTYFDKKGNLRSKTDGTLTHYDNVFEVHEVLEFESIDIKTGNINHNGSIVIEKDIHDGVTVKAEGSIIVRGNIGAATVEAKRNILVENGINGAYKALVHSHEGSIAAKFIRNSSIRCKENLIVRVLLNDCKVWVGKSIKVNEHQGRILGGEYHAYKEVTTHDIGSVAGWKTNITVGTPIDIVYQISSLKKKIADLEAQTQNKVDDINNSLMYTKDKQKQIQQEIQNLQKTIHDLNEEMQVLEEKKSEVYEKATITAWGKVHPGVVIQIGEHRWENKYIRNRIAFLLSNNGHNIIMEKLR